MRSEYFHRKATTSLEFAMVFPIFMLLVMGIFEFGKTVYKYHLNANAVREIAREASVKTSDPATVTGVLEAKFKKMTGAEQIDFGLTRGVFENYQFKKLGDDWKMATSDQYICAYGEIPVDLNLIFFKYTFYLKAQCCIKSEAL